MNNFNHLLKTDKYKFGNKYYNIKKHQSIFHDEKFYNKKLDPVVSVSSTPHISTTNIDFELDELYGCLFNDLIFSFMITENNTSAVNIIDGPEIISNVQVICSGKTLCEYDGKLLYVFNCLDVDNGSSEKNIMDACGISNDFVTVYPLAKNASKDYFINLYTILSNLLFNKDVLK